MSQIFGIGQNILLFNSRIMLFSSKLRSKWSTLFEVVRMTPQGDVELWKKYKSTKFPLNGQTFKHY